MGAVWVRSRALRRARSQSELRSVFLADNLWGLAAVLWIGTGVLRAFAGLEKGTAYYVSAPPFHVKMGLLGLILLLEIWPMTTLIRWRAAGRRGAPVDLARAPVLARISEVQAGLVILMVFAATALARGFLF